MNNDADLSTRPPSSALSGIRDNHTRGRIADFLTERMATDSALSVVSAYFTIYAYQALARQLERASVARMERSEIRGV